MEKGGVHSRVEEGSSAAEMKGDKRSLKALDVIALRYLWCAELNRGVF